MTKAQYQRVERLVMKLAPVWRERMGLSHVEIEHVFLDSFFGDDGEEDFKVTAVCEGRWNYLQAKIKWYLPSAVRHSDERIEETLVHELCHVLLASEQSIPDTAIEPEQEWIDACYEKIELATEMASRAILRGWRSALA